MTYETRATFRIGRDQTLWFFSVDMPLCGPQVQDLYDEVEAEVNLRMLKPRSKAARLTNKWFQHLLSVDHDHYGSFRFNFDESMENFSTAELTEFNDDILDIVGNSDIISRLCHVKEMDECLEDFLEHESAEELMRSYIDLLQECHYRPEQSDLENTFLPHLTDKQAVSKELLMRSLRGEDVELSKPKKPQKTIIISKNGKVQKAQNKDAWPFEAA